MCFDRITLGRQAKELGFVRDTLNVSRESMLTERTQISEHIQKYMSASGYTLSLKSKQYHALDSFVYEPVHVGKGRNIFRGSADENIVDEKREGQYNS